MTSTVIAGILCFTACVVLPDTKKSRVGMCVCACIAFILQAGLRDYLHQINDTLNYLRSYDELLPLNIKEVWQDSKFGFSSYSDRDPGFTLLMKVTQMICPDFVFFLFFVAVIISIPLARLLYQFTNSTKGIALGIMVYEALFAGFFETGIRQTIAMGIIYLSMPYIIQRKWLPHYIMLAVAVTIHSSSLIFAPFYFLSGMKIKKNYLLMLLFATPLFMMLAPVITSLIGEDTMFEQYTLNEEDNSGTPMFSAILVLIAFAAWLARGSFKENNIKDRIMYISIMCSLVLMPTTWVNSNFIRLLFYFEVFFMGLIPHIINGLIERESLRNTCYCIAGGLLMIISH